MAPSQEVASRHRFRVAPSHDGLRLDQAISAHLPNVSRTLAKKVLRDGGAFVDKRRVKIAGKPVHTGQTIEIYVSERTRSDTPLADYKLTIIAETESYIVVDKPSGLFSAPTPEGDQSDVLALLRHSGNQTDLFLVHRLDRPTSGLMVIAKTRSAAANLSKQVASHHMHRTYEALLLGALQASEMIHEPIEGKHASTVFFPIEQRAGVIRVQARLETGRTHQVRIHAAHRGTPVLGDTKYGRSIQRHFRPRPPRLALHATLLAFDDPESGGPVEFRSELPEDMAVYFAQLPLSSTTC